MKTIIILIVTIFIISINTSLCSEADRKSNDKEAYAENVHMYVCIEALKLLKDRFPQTDFSLIENHMGSMEDCGTKQWQVGTITVGACREDMEDPVFDIRGPFGLEASCSHFWDADDRTNGDHSLTHLSGIGNFPNSYTKMTKYLDGQWFRWSNGYHERQYINYLHVDGKIYKYSYHTRGFINFYKTKTIFLHSKVNTLGQEEIIDHEVVLTDYVFHKIVWEILGRMAHHTEDMTVPAHAHCDVHIRPLDGGDCFHNFIDDGGYTFYNWQTAKAEGGYINPYETGNDPIRYLMYTANQLADHYPSGPDCLEIPQQHSGDHNLPGGSYPIINQYYQQLGSPPLNITNTYQEGQHCFNFAIRATAGLLYWFAVETGMITPDPGALPVINSFSKNLPDKTLYRGETFRLTCNASGSNLNYNWFYKVCNLNNWCVFPINGLSFNQNNNVYSVSNYYFNNRWTCSFFDSLCNATSPVNNIYYENPLQIIFGVTVSNQFAQVTKYYDLDQIQKITPFNGIRPPNPPVSGCPFVFTKIEDEFKIENNVLHKSNFFNNQGNDIEDKLIIVNEPFTDTTDKTVQFALDESAGDVDYFDRIGLKVICYPEDFDVALTIHNDIVLIRREDIVSPDNAEINGTNITSDIAYDSAINKRINGREKDIINMEFKKKNRLTEKELLITELQKSNYTSEKINNISDSIALILDPSEPVDRPILNNKRPAGYISVTDSAGNKNTEDIDFAGRVLRSEVLIPVLKDNTITTASLVFKDGFDLSYCASSRIFYGGYTEAELELAEADNSVTGDVLKKLQKEDRIYAVMDSSSFITLKFKNKVDEIPKGWVKKYIRIVKGRTVEPERDHTVYSNNVSMFSDISKSVPGEYELFQNYPNPFNPVTEIKYSLPEDQFTKLTVYDMLGKEVVSLVNEKQNTGNYSVNFDAGNLPSGIYYYKITAGMFSKVRKMIVLK